MSEQSTFTTETMALQYVNSGNQSKYPVDKTYTYEWAVQVPVGLTYTEKGLLRMGFVKCLSDAFSTCKREDGYHTDAKGKQVKDWRKGTRIERDQDTQDRLQKLKNGTYPFSKMRLPPEQLTIAQQALKRMLISAGVKFDKDMRLADGLTTCAQDTAATQEIEYTASMVMELQEMLESQPAYQEEVDRLERLVEGESEVKKALDGFKFSSK